MRKIFLILVLLVSGICYAQSDSVTKSLNETSPSFSRYKQYEYEGIWPEQSPGMTIFIVSILSAIIIGLIILVIRKSKGYGSTVIVGGFPRGSIRRHYISSSSIYSKRKKRGSGPVGGAFMGGW
ncbi:MAG: hypothetical protein JST55_12190 [Bacteroidetes bacterium]|nr:hypothetical protein [Bacteroidota bacterium]